MRAAGYSMMESDCEVTLDGSIKPGRRARALTAADFELRLRARQSASLVSTSNFALSRALAEIASCAQAPRPAATRCARIPARPRSAAPRLPPSVTRGICGASGGLQLLTRTSIEEARYRRLHHRDDRLVRRDLIADMAKFLAPRRDGKFSRPFRRSERRPCRCGARGSWPHHRP